MQKRGYTAYFKTFVLAGFSIVIFSSSPALAAVLTTLEYTETRQNFDWVFEVDDRPFLPTPFSITPKDAPDPNTGQVGVRWMPKFEWKAFLGGLPPEFQASGQHTSRFHIEDTAEGNLFSSGFMKYALINNVSAGFTAIFEDKDPDHPAIGGPHKNLYSLFWKRANNNSDVTFEFKGRHVGRGTPIPEPSSLLLLGWGLGALAVCLRKNRASSSE